MTKIRVTNKAEYQAYLNSPKWQATRKRLYKLYDYKCDKCGSPKNLCVHHITYENLGEEKDDDLVVLCQRCHRQLHDPFNSIDYLMIAEGEAYLELDADNDETKNRAKWLAPLISEFIEIVKQIDFGKIDYKKGDYSVSLIRHRPGESIRGK